MWCSVSGTAYLFQWASERQRTPAGAAGDKGPAYSSSARVTTSASEWIMARRSSLSPSSPQV